MQPDGGLVRILAKYERLRVERIPDDARGSASASALGRYVPTAIAARRGSEGV